MADWTLVADMLPAGVSVVVAAVWSPVFVPDTFVAVRFPASSISTDEDWMIFPVVASKRAIALSVAEAGQATNPETSVDGIVIIVVSFPESSVAVTPKPTKLSLARLVREIPSSWITCPPPPPQVEEMVKFG